MKEGDDEKMIDNKKIQETHDKSYVVPSKETVKAVSKRMLNKHRETLERLANR